MFCHIPCAIPLTAPQAPLRLSRHDLPKSPIEAREGVVLRSVVRGARGAWRPGGGHVAFGAD